MVAIKNGIPYGSLHPLPPPSPPSGACLGAEAGLTTAGGGGCTALEGGRSVCAESKCAFSAAFPAWVVWQTGHCNLPPPP
jgi:hypothetical protein